jgi:hypothetical protein
VKGKKIYIPENIEYALPATEKQFTGDFPSGTCITVPRDVAVGIHWFNVQSNRIDLDLSLISLNEKFGWDSRYRSDDRQVLFSGDMTDAPLPNGASELFRVSRQAADTYIVMLNYFNYEKEVKVPAKIFVAESATLPQAGSNQSIWRSASENPRTFVVNPNLVICAVKTEIAHPQSILGILTTTPTESKFYFSQSAIGKSITSRSDDRMNQARRFLYHFYTDTLSLKEVLEAAGAKLVTEPKGADIDLSPEKLERDKIIALLR